MRRGVTRDGIVNVLYFGYKDVLPFVGSASYRRTTDEHVCIQPGLKVGRHYQPK